ncbi:MAG: hypothetical protein ACLFST_03815 [Spirochaetia bacterium]
MVRTELVKRSPLRILEKSIHGGVGAGNIAVIASRKGVGKTACLVHIGTDSLFQGKHVIHVSFSSRTDHIISWYEDIFKEIARRRELDSAMDVHDEIIKNRVIMNFNQEAIKPEQIIKSIRAMITDGNFAADLIIVDGYNFNRATPEAFNAFKSFASEHNLTIWFSASVHPEDPVVKTQEGVPGMLEPHMDKISVLISLTPINDRVRLELKKDHDHMVTEDLHLILDSKSLLIASE